MDDAGARFGSEVPILGQESCVALRRTGLTSNPYTAVKTRRTHCCLVVRTTNGHDLWSGRPFPNWSRYRNQRVRRSGKRWPEWPVVRVSTSSPASPAHGSCWPPLWSSPTRSPAGPAGPNPPARRKPVASAGRDVRRHRFRCRGLMTRPHESSANSESAGRFGDRDRLPGSMGLPRLSAGRSHEPRSPGYVAL